jgi:hypothetical protein
MSERALPDPSAQSIPGLLPDEHVWATLALPSLTLLATDRRLLSWSGDRMESWDYEAITQVGPAAIDGDVAISFGNGHRPLIVHADGNDSVMQALTVIGLLVARTHRPDRSVARSSRGAG